MKKVLIIIIFLASFSSLCQDLKREELQKEWFMTAEKYLKRNKSRKALMQFDLVDNLSLNTEYKSIATKKIDSLIPILQGEEMKKWIGNWELGQLKTNMFDFEKINITDEYISFFKKKTDKIADRVEKIKIADYKPNQYVSIHSVVFENNEIWEFKVERHKRHDRLFVRLKTNSEGITYSIIDERAMLVDRKERRKAKSEEIRTFYNRIN